MRFFVSALTALMGAVLLSACSREPDTTHRTFLAFGTLVEVTIVGVEPERAERAIDQVQQEFDYMHRTWQPWEAGALARMNSLLPTGEWFSAAPSVLPLIEQATKLAEESGNRFDPAIGKLIKLWGFDSGEPAGPPPDKNTVAALVTQAPRMSDIQVDGIRVRSTNPAVVLDFGAFAKGYGVDRTIELLRGLGINNAIINAGGDLRAIGRHGDRPWRIGIRAPRSQGILASVEVSGDESVFTSGDYERFFEYQGKRYHHILDPATGYPARGLTSVTVIATEGARADAAATALFVAGPQHWRAVAHAMGMDQVMVVLEDGSVQMTPKMKPRIHFEGQSPPEVVVEAGQ